MELRAVFGIYNYIKNRRGWVKTEEIYNFSKSFGVKKRNFYNYLNNLERCGLIESKKEGKEKFWKVKENFTDFEFIDDEQLGFIVFLLGSLNPNVKEKLKN